MGNETHQGFSANCLCCTCSYCSPGVASAPTLSYPYFPIPTTTTCSSATSYPSYCVTPAAGTSYSVSPTDFNADYSVWAEAGSPYRGWGDSDKLMSMCVAHWESGSYTYNLHDNYPSEQYNSDRFDYGLMQVNSLGHRFVRPLPNNGESLFQDGGRL